MAEVLFAFDKYNYKNCQNQYRGDKNQEYYLGDYTIEAGSVIDVRAEKTSIGACSIINLSSKTKLQFNRSWYHIRQDATDVIVLWFVKRGKLSINHAGGKAIARAGDFAITKSMTPFSITCSVGDDAQHEVLHVLVPAHVFREFLPQEVINGFCSKVANRSFSLASRLFAELLDLSGDLSLASKQATMEAALSLLADGLGSCESLIQERTSIADQRLQEVLRYIEKHLSDSQLSTAKVSDACGISQRYLSSLLKQKGTSFSEFVWDQRLKIASRWLASSQPNEISIAEIAFRVGFKSPAHFSRMFKRVYNKGPREYRSEHSACQSSAVAPQLSEAARSTLQ